MKKSMWMLVLLVFCLTVLPAFDKKSAPLSPHNPPELIPKITIVNPESSSSPNLAEGGYEEIKWTCSAYFQVHPQNCQLFWGPHRISNDVPVLSGKFIWNGKRYDGTTFPIGDQKITIKCPDYETPDGPRYVIAESSLDVQCAFNSIRVRLRSTSP
jgi:hypothetical protein